MTLSTLKIGSIESFPNLVLAPMSGVTNSCFRRLIREENPGAVGLVVTEFISIEGLTRGNQKTFSMLSFRPEEEPISIQIFGYDIDRMVLAAKMIQDSGAQIVDINSGCPVPKVVKRGGGCELMRQSGHLKKMLDAVVAAVSIPVTLKIRSGWEESCINAPEIARMAEDSGVQMLAVHGRTRAQLYRGLADWDIIEEISKSISIPVVGSGDVVDLDSARLALRPGMSGLMIGRGAMYNPWIFSDLLEGFNSIPMTNDANADSIRPGSESNLKRPLSEIPRVLLRYADMLVEDVGERGALGKMKQLISQITRSIPGSADLRRELCSRSSLPLIRDRLHRLYFELQNNEALRGANQISGSDISFSRRTPAAVVNPIENRT